MKNNFNLRTFLTENKLTSNSKINENIEAFSDTIQVVGYPKTVEDALKVIERYERDRDPVSREEAKEIIADMRATDDDDFDRNITNLIAKAFNIKLKGVSEKKVNERNDIVPTAELKATDAFRDAGIDMSKPVLVVKLVGGHGEPDKQVEVPAAKALSMFKALRAQALETGREDHYEFDNELNFSAEGYEYKLSYFEEESTTTILMQKSGVSEKKVNEEDFDSVDSLAAFTDTIQVVGYPKTVEDALKIIERYERDRDPVSREEAKDLVAGMRATDEDDFDRNITNLIVKAFNIKLKGVSEKKVNEQLASQAVQEFIAADNNGVSIAEFVKAMIDGAAEFNQEEAAYQDLDKRSEVILKAIGRQDLIGGTNETAPGYMHDCAAKVMHEKYGNGDCIPEEHTLIKEGNKYVVTHYDVLFESGKTVKNIPVKELKIITESHHGHKRRKK